MSFGFASVGHFFASVAHEFVKVGKAVGAVAPKVAALAPEIELLTGLVAPNAVPLERGAFALFGEVAAAIEKAGDAAGQNGLNLQLDAALVADIKALIPAIRQYAASVGSVAPKP